MKIREYMKGTITFRITGADPEGCLNRLNEEGIYLWNIRRIVPLTVECTTFTAKESKILALCEKAYCTGNVVKQEGCKQDIKKACYRPFLILSVVLAFILTFSMDNLVWKIKIDAEDRNLEREIRLHMRELGVDIWTKTDRVDSQTMKYELLQRIPELSWVAVNTKGGTLVVLALSGEEEKNEDNIQPGNLVSVCDGVITDSVVLEGMALSKVGDTVQKGEILVSGAEDYGLYLRLVRADGEIYGQTWHRGTLVTPSQRHIKTYTGRTWTENWILFGRKSINLSGSSSILGASCDKIISTKQISLPGYPFPLYLQRVTYREYTTQTIPLLQEEAQELLCRSWDSCLLSSMVAGRVEKTEYECFEQGSLYIFEGKSICNELLSRLVPFELPEKGANEIGTNYQRRTN